MSTTRLGPGGYPVAGTVKAYVLSADAGSFAITGQPAALLKGSVLQADAGAYVITGKAASLIKGSVLAADAGAYVISGKPAALLKNSVLGADPGSYIVTGYPALLEVNTPVNNLVKAIGDWLALSRRWKYAREEPPKPLIVKPKRKKDMIAAAKAIAAQPMATEARKPEPQVKPVIIAPPLPAAPAKALPTIHKPPVAAKPKVTTTPQPAIIKEPTPAEEEAEVMEALTALMPAIRKRLKERRNGRTGLR